ncbi:atexp7,atexpa7,athexp alpha 1.26,exp7,expa7, partial [Sarracenia purpurea var. burkii]
MASSLRSWTVNGLFLLGCIMSIVGVSKSVSVFRPSQWALAHATFYGDESASATM